jgi:hypothetical protein
VIPTPLIRSVVRSYRAFELTILGTYDEGVLSASDYSFLAIIIFLVAVLCVLVVTLNATHCGSK